MGKSAGWRNESGRHALAARGIKTNLPERRLWRTDQVVGPKEIESYDDGAQDATDTFYLAGHRNILIEDSMSLEKEMKRGGASRSEIDHALDRMIVRRYSGAMRGIESDLADRFNDLMADKHGGERLDIHWADAHPGLYDAYVTGYKNKMRELFKGI